MSSIHWRYILFWLAIPALLFLPLFAITPLEFFGNSDALFYSNILSLTSDALAKGEWFPRWLADANAGFGSPVMMFYAPLAYFLTALINFPFAPLHFDIGIQLLIGIYASQTACGYTSYLWLKRDFTPRVAFTGSLLFVLLPYKLIYIYIHVNLAQLWALALLPLWMMAAEDMAAGSRRAIGAYALLLAAVYYTHPLTLIAFGTVPIVHVLWFGRSALARNAVRLTVAHLLGLGICAMQAVPGHLYIRWVHADLFFSGNYSWQHNFFHIDVVLCIYYGVIALLMGFAIRKLPALKQDTAARRSLFWIVMLCIVLFLTQSISNFVWQVVTPLQYLQFPAARLHAVALMAVVYLIAFWLTHYKEMLPLGGIAYRRATLLVLIACFVFATCWRVYAVASDPKYASPDYMEQGRLAKLISTPVAIYKTNWDCIDVARAFDLYRHNKVPPPVSFASGKGVLSAIDWRPPEHIAFAADVRSDDAQIAIRQCYLPLWKASDENGKDIPLIPEKDNGVITFSLPKGRHTVAISMDSLPVEGASRALAFLSLAIGIGLACVKYRPSYGQVA